MKAMILAAGLGTRLQPLTDNKPKALVSFKGIPMLERVIRSLVRAGCDHIVVNVHHFAGQVVDFLDQFDVPGVQFNVSDESEGLMDTGGALLHAREFFQDEKDFLVHNVDVVTSLDIRALIAAHRNSEALATLAVKKRQTSRSLLFDQEGFLSGWRHNETGEKKLVRGTGEGLEDYGNSCIQVINGEFFRHFPETGALNLINMYLELAKDYQVRAFIHNDDYWYDLGRYDSYLKADKEVF